MAAPDPAGKYRRNQANEADRAAHGDAGAHAKRTEANHPEPQPRDIVAQRLHDFLAQHQRIERTTQPSQQDNGNRGRNGSEGRLAEAAIDQRTHQPLIGVVKGKGGGGEGERS